MVTSKEICYYTDRLQEYLNESFPELADDMALVKSQADMAAQAYSDAFLQGYHADVCNDIATKALFKGLVFSKYNTISEVLFHEFSREINEEK